MTAEEQILQNLKHSEKRYHLFKATLIVITTIVLLVFIAFQANYAIKTLTKDNQKTRDYISCIVKFFSQPDRANKTVKNIDSCTIGEIPR